VERAFLVDAQLLAPTVLRLTFVNIFTDDSIGSDLVSRRARAVVAADGVTASVVTAAGVVQTLVDVDALLLVIRQQVSMTTLALVRASAVVAHVLTRIRFTLVNFEAGSFVGLQLKATVAGTLKRFILWFEAGVLTSAIIQHTIIHFFA